MCMGILHVHVVTYIHVHVSALIHVCIWLHCYQCVVSIKHVVHTPTSAVLRVFSSHHLSLLGTCGTAWLPLQQQKFGKSSSSQQTEPSCCAGEESQLPSSAKKHYVNGSQTSERGCRKLMLGSSRMSTDSQQNTPLPLKVQYSVVHLSISKLLRCSW